jgi:hypothetical protein
MWIREATPEQVAELLHNYQNALGICGKGSESGSFEESPQSEKNTVAAEVDAEPKSHQYFSQTGEAEWGC